MWSNSPSLLLRRLQELFGQTKSKPARGSYRLPLPYFFPFFLAAFFRCVCLDLVELIKAFVASDAVGFDSESLNSNPEMLIERGFCSASAIDTSSSTSMIRNTGAERDDQQYHNVVSIWRTSSPAFSAKRCSRNKFSRPTVIKRLSIVIKSTAILIASDWFRTFWFVGKADIKERKKGKTSHLMRRSSRNEDTFTWLLKYSVRFDAMLLK